MKESLLFIQNTSNDELTVNQHCNGQGHCYYHVYDPTTRKSSAFGSEQEMRVLLD